MNYIWSKKSLLEFIENSILEIVSEKKYTFSDLFAWTWIVWRYFKEKWYSVIANDLQYYSFVLNKNYIENHVILLFEGLLNDVENLKEAEVKDRKDFVIEYLNGISWEKWFIYNNYSLWGTKWQEFERQYFSDENALKCDAIRIKIEEWKKSEKITDWEYYFLLTSLLESIDKVANTASVYWAFLKKLKKTAKISLQLQSADFFLNENKYEVYNQDINELIKNKEFDIVYLDPPYNERQYSANYHILETIAKYDNPDIKWKTGLRDYSNQKSNYCKKWEAKKSFTDLIKSIDAKYIFLSYNSDWLLSLEEIKEIMSTRWEYWFFEKEYKRFKADKTENRNHNQKVLKEYLHYVIVKK